MSMSRKDYRAAAAVIKAELEQVADYSDRFVAQASIASIARALAENFKRDNSAFRYDTFFEACGLDYDGKVES